MKLKILIILICLANVNIFAQAKRYDQQMMRKIKLLSTSKKQAEKIIGRKIERYGDMGTVKVPYGVVIFFFSSGNCKENLNSGWDFPNNTVVRVDFSLAKKLRVSNFNFLGMRVVQDDSNPPIYIDDSTGISYHTESGRVEVISYEPPAKFDYLRCKQKNTLTELTLK